MNAILAIAIVICTSLAGGFFTNRGMTWYENARPPHAPPRFVFPIVWTILYALIAIALARIPVGELASTLLLLNLALNIVWCYLYFGKRMPRASFAAILAIVITAIGVIIIALTKHDLVIVFCLTPYLAWLLFATFLNWETIEMTRLGQP